MKVICVSGTPGTGKTYIAKLLSKKLDYNYINVKKIIKENNLIDSYDKQKKCNVIDTKKLNKFLIKIIKTNNVNSINTIIDSHLSHYLPKKYIDLCIITKCNLKELKKRLKKRRYNKEKLRENLDCEIFDVCLNEAIENNHNLLQIDTSKKINEKKIIENINKKTK
jgi:adenylate kinase